MLPGWATSLPLKFEPCPEEFSFGFLSFSLLHRQFHQQFLTHAE